MGKSVLVLKGALLRRVYLMFLTVYRIGLFPFFRYSLASNNSIVQLKIEKRKVFVRKGTPDLRVAIESLFGEFDILKYLLPMDYSGIIIDAGGYIGTATIALKEHFPKSKIIVIEPSEENIRIIKMNTEDLQGVNIVHGALVGKPVGKITLKDRETGQWGYTVVSNPNDNPKALNLKEVNSFRISDLVENCDDIGILKLDIEGAEYDIFKEDINTLQRIDVIFVELHDKIVSGCTDAFFNFSSKRIVVKGKGEKYLSIKK